MVFDNLSFGLALVAGLVSFLSPCVRSLVPVYLGYLGSRAVTPGGTVVTSRWDTFSHGVAFVQPGRATRPGRDRQPVGQLVRAVSGRDAGAAAALRRRARPRYNL